MLSPATLMPSLSFSSSNTVLSTSMRETKHPPIVFYLSFFGFALLHKLAIGVKYLTASYASTSARLQHTN